MEMAVPVLGAAVDVADPDLDEREEEEWGEEEEGQQQEVEHRDNEVEGVRGVAGKPFRYEIFQVIGSLVISLAWTLAICGVEESLNSRIDIEDPLPALLITQLRLRVPAIIVPVLFLAFSGPMGSRSTHSVRRNACLLTLYVLLVAPFVVLPFLLPRPCSFVDTYNDQHPPIRGFSSTDSVRAEEASRLWRWISCCGPVFLVSIISAAKLYRARNMLVPVAASIKAPMAAPMADPIEAPMAAPMAVPMAVPMAEEAPGELDLLALDEAELSLHRARG